jgi:putative tricarboxylic transport membrane protein
MIKGLLSGLVGILLALVGMDTLTSVSRFTFGTTALLSGFNLIPVLIGVFAVSEVLYQVRHACPQGSTQAQPSMNLARTYIPIKEVLKFSSTLIRSSLIGTFVGIVPGTGGGIAAFIAYDVTKRVSKNPEALGKGSMEGVAAPESANNAVTGGALVPLLTLGIPGDAVTAVLISAFMIQGLQPGPLLFQNNPRTVYALLAGLFLANIAMYVIGVFCVKIYAQVLRIPILMLCPIILLLCFVGSYAVAGSLLDMCITMVMGIVGYYFRLYGFPSGPLVIGLILGPMVEKSLRQALTASQGDWAILISSPIAIAFFLLTAISLFLPFIMRKKNIEE